MTSPKHPTEDAKPTPAERAGAEALERLLGVMRRLRAEDGCPWDREQTLDSLKPHLIEECYEAVDALESGDRRKLAEELGDVLLQVVFQSRVCEEEGSFAFSDVANGLIRKLVRRHPHVFGETTVSDAQEVLRNWEVIKGSEGGSTPRPAVDGLPRHLPALHKAQRLQQKVARIGFDWPTVDGAEQKIDEELREVRAAVSAGSPEQVRAELGDLLFAVVNLCRFHGCEAEDALNGAVGRFAQRFRGIEQRLQAQGKRVTDCTLDELDAIWDDVKRDEAAKETPTETP